MAVAFVPDLVLPEPPSRPSLTIYRPPSRAAGRPPRPPAARRHSAAVYRRRRLVVLGLVAAAVVGVGLAVRSWERAPGAGLPPSRPVVTRVWVVHPGDTLWSIALETGDTGDIRPLVDRLSAEVHDQPLQVGEQLTLP